VPDFRFEACEEQFALKFTKICELFRDYQAMSKLKAEPEPTLSQPFDIRQMLKTMKLEGWQKIHPLRFYLTPL